ncbi:MAG: HAMP domain-containing sensor histidine kinase [Clostridiaceae bacterium]
MNTIRYKLAIAITVSSLLALILTYIIINFNINWQYSIYIKSNQESRDERIVGEFRDAYVSNGKKGWTLDSGTNVIEEAQTAGFSVKLENQYHLKIWELETDLIISELNAKQPESSPPITIEQFSFGTHDVIVDGDVVGYITIGQFTPLLISKNEEQFVFSLTISVLASAVIGSVLIFLLSIFLSKQLSEPISSIASTSYLLSNGNFKARENISTDIAEIEKLRLSINILGEKLDQQDTLRRRLISDISHELRNPLNVLQMNLEAMIDGVVPTTPERLSSLNNEVIRFGNLLGNLNVLKEFESATISPPNKEVNLKSLCQDIYNNFLGITQEKKLNFSFEFYRKDQYIIIGDYHSLYQVVINLIHNAIKFTPEGGRIFLTLKKDLKFTYLEVRDTGMGIPAEDLPNIFERFYRVDRSREQIEGSGIGLTIVKRIMDSQGGTILVTSAENRGTTFTLKFRNPLVTTGLPKNLKAKK